MRSPNEFFCRIWNYVISPPPFCFLKKVFYGREDEAVYVCFFAYGIVQFRPDSSASWDIVLEGREQRMSMPALLCASLVFAPDESLPSWTASPLEDKSRWLYCTILQRIISSAPSSLSVSECEEGYQSKSIAKASHRIWEALLLNLSKSAFGSASIIQRYSSSLLLQR